MNTYIIVYLLNYIFTISWFYLDDDDDYPEDEIYEALDDISNLHGPYYNMVKPVPPVKKDENFICKHCDQRFAEQHFLNDHVSNFHMPVKCMKCKKNFVNNKWFENHTCKNDEQLEKRTIISNKKSATKNNSMNDVEYSISDEPSTLSSPIPVSTTVS